MKDFRNMWMVFIQCNKEIQKALCKAQKPYRGLILCFLEDGKHTGTDTAGFGAGTGDLVGIDSLGGIGIDFRSQNSYLI